MATGARGGLGEFDPTREASNGAGIVFDPHWYETLSELFDVLTRFQKQQWTLKGSEDAVFSPARIAELIVSAAESMNGDYVFPVGRGEGLEDPEASHRHDAITQIVNDVQSRDSMRIENAEKRLCVAYLRALTSSGWLRVSVCKTFVRHIQRDRESVVIHEDSLQLIPLSNGYVSQVSRFTAGSIWEILRNIDCLPLRSFVKQFPPDYGERGFFPGNEPVPGEVERVRARWARLEDLEAAANRAQSEGLSE